MTTPPLALPLLDLEDGLHLNGGVGGKALHADGRACMDAPLAQHLMHQFGVAVHDAPVVTEAGRRVHHSQRLHDALDPA